MVDGGRGRTRTWPEVTAARPVPAWSGAAARLIEQIGRRLRSWAQTDTAPGRLMPWLAVAYGTGVVLYFTAGQEPVWWAGIALSCAGAGAAFAVRAQPIAFPVLLGLTAIGGGFATGTLRGVIVGHSVLPHTAPSVAISGYVEVREDRERSDRIVVRVEKMEAARLSARPDRVRLSVRKGTAPAVGSRVSFKARLNPPLQPLRPGGYDFARDLYFQGIGATGFVLGRIKVENASAPPGFWLRYAAAIGGIRDGIDERIRSAISGDRGSIASAVITGKRDAISTPVNDAMYISSLAHVLSISGYHMAVVAGVVFFVIRAGLALIPQLANRKPIKKWAALGALCAATFYLLLSGAEVATQRSYIMTAVVLAGVMFDRPALTLRTISVAALAVLFFHPEAVVHPSFQMSFAATLALVAGYERGLPWFSNVPDTSLGARVALWGGREVAGLVVASLLAGLATTPYSAFHFHRLAPYGVLANLLAMPVVSAWVMPAGMLAVLAMPFGFDGLFWNIMASGIDWMIAVALWVSSLPGAVGRVCAFGIGPLVLGSGGLLMVCLLRSPLRWSGVGLAATAALWAAMAAQPAIYVSGDGQIAAIRNGDGQLSIAKTRNDDFIVKEWLAADADKRNASDASLGAGIVCDRAGCIARLFDGTRVALSKDVSSLEEDCLHAGVLVTSHTPPSGCGALVIERGPWRAGASVALYSNGAGFDVVESRPPGYSRPWTGMVATIPDPATIARYPAQDATPRPEDLAADD